MTAVKDECADHKASWSAKLVFRGLFCFSPSEELEAQQFAEIDLFEYTKAVYKGPSNIIIRFDPNDYPVTANAWSGGGGKALIADLQQAAKASNTDLISKGEDAQVIVIFGVLRPSSKVSSCTSLLQENMEG